MNAAIPPSRWALATACSATVVFPLPSGPYISTIRPRGRPPMPSATSSEIAPVGITSIGARPSSPSRMIEPLPNCRSIWASAVSRDLSLSPALPAALSLPALSLPAMWTPVGIKGFLPDQTLRATTDKLRAQVQHRGQEAADEGRHCKPPLRGHGPLPGTYLRRTTVRPWTRHAESTEEFPGDTRVSCPRRLHAYSPAVLLGEPSAQPTDQVSDDGSVRLACVAAPASGASSRSSITASRSETPGTAAPRGILP